MKLRTLAVPVGALFLLGGCVTVPSGPAVRVMPGTQKTFEAFQTDDANCRQYAQAAIGGPNAGQAGADAAAANAVVGTLIGAAAGAILGSVSNQGGQGAAIGAGTGFLFGSAAGANTAGASSYVLQRNYDSAYAQCMYAHGNQVPGQMVYRRPPPAYTQPYYPPPNAPAPMPPAENYPPPSYAPSYPPPNTPPPRG